MLAVKSVLGTLLMPLSLISIVLVLGVALLWLAPRRALGRLLVTLAAAGLVLAGLNPLAERLIRPFERAYPALIDASELEDIDYVAVLGGGHLSDPELPITAQLTDTALVRLAEGLRLHRQLPDSRLVVSGWGGNDPNPHAFMMRSAAVALGADPERVLALPEPRDTAEEAAALRELIGDRRFILVTEASHMPRAVALMAGQGLHPIPAPTRHFARLPQTFGPGQLVPQGHALVVSARVAHEALGRLYARIVGLD